MKEENNFEVPFQVQTLITTLKDKNERVNIRGNYRTRLIGIKNAIEKALNEYDYEMGYTTPSPKFKKGSR
jgi:hypothetical protein